MEQNVPKPKTNKSKKCKYSLPKFHEINIIIMYYYYCSVFSNFAIQNASDKNLKPTLCASGKEALLTL